MSNSEELRVGNIVFDGIQNRYEKKVIKALNRICAEKSGELLTEKDVRDIYALALNQLPTSYAQPGTIVLGDAYSQETIDDIVLKAFDKIYDNPKP